MPKVTTFNQPPNVPALEEEILSFWEADRTFKKSVESRPADKAYVFYDGPPFATGMPHYGHLLASTTKDVIPRYQTMKGFRVNRVWGWDCHGLPIENMIEKQLKIKDGKKGIEALGIDKFNQACQTEVLRLDKEWEKIIARLGRWVDFENNYKTMDSTFMESVWWGFSQLYDKGMVYEGKRVILYCPRCATPLSNFEIVMDNSYQEVNEPSSTYKYEVVDQPQAFLLAWSTTPWNKLATPALAVHPDLPYVKVKQGDEYYILAESTLGHLSSEEFEIVETFIGKELEDLKFKLHYDFYSERLPTEKVGVVIADDFVTAEEGTGIVTLAVYGEDDFRVMKEHGVQLVEHVDEEGKLKPEVTPWAGLPILESNALVDADLKERGLLYQHLPHNHMVPTCYRCSTRLYYAPVPAWFIDIQHLKKNLKTQNEYVNWYPQHLKHGRFGKGLETAPDWNISRSRYWGTPMPIWQATDKDGNIQRRIINSIQDLQKWAVDQKAAAKITDIHRQFIDKLEVWIDDEKTIKGTRIPEVFDCWVESSSMPFASIHYPFENKEFFENNYPAQFVSEYIAQTRAWFYTMHVLSVGIFGKPPFENVLTTGTILAEDGSKMSKSKKNYPDPMLLINKYGVDSLRLYLMSSPVMKGENLNFNEKEVSDIRRKVFVVWWNIYSFYHQFADQKADWKNPPAEPQHVMDKWLLSRIQSLNSEVTKYFDNYDVVKASRSLMEFVTELSTWYLRLSRGRFRQEKNQEPSQVLGYAIYTLAQLFAPLAPFFSELIHHQLVDDKTSIHLTDWPKIDESLQHLELENKMKSAQEIVSQAHALRKETGFKLRQPLAELKVSSPNKSPKDNLLEVIAQETNVKKVTWTTGDNLSIKLDTKLTPELEAEGQARELMRNIQKLRRQAKLTLEDVVKVTAPDWPADWKKAIEKQTHVELLEGDELAIVE